MSHSVTYAELHSADVPSSTDFYRRLFGWKSNQTDTPMGPYISLDGDDGPIGGVFNRPDGGDRPHWLVYISTDDLEASVASAVELGAKVRVEPAVVPDQGSYAILDDPQGAVFALWQALGSE